MPQNERPIAAFVVSLIAGLWMLIMGGMTGWGYMSSGHWGGEMHGGNQGRAGAYNWMWQRHEMMHGYGGGGLWFWLGALAAVVVVIAALALYSRPATAPRWGVVIMVVSCLAFLAGVGGFLAGILGMIGGVLAITWKPQA
jgi:hypothetical protein